MDKVCLKCGKQLQPDQGFCDQCGAAWTPSEDGAASPAVAQYVAPAPSPVVVTSSRRWPVAVLALLAIAAIGIGAWYFVTSRSIAATNLAASSSTSTVTASTTAPTVSAAPVSAAEVIPPIVDSAAATTTASVAASDAATEAAADSKQCSLVTRAEMESVLGSKIVKVTVDGQICSYFTDADRSAQVDTTWTGGRAALTEAKGFNQGLLTPVPNIGDEAYLQAAGVLHVLKGDTYVVVNSREYPNELENESAIARKVMEKMK